MTTGMELVNKTEPPAGSWKAKAPMIGKWKKIYFINLEKDSYRKEYILKQLNKEKLAYGIPVERHAGTDPKAAKKFNLRTFTDLGVADYLAKGEERTMWGTIGTYASHLGLLQKIAHDNPEGEELYAILEDDVKLDKAWKQTVEKALVQNGVPKDWDILKFGYWGAARCEDKVSDRAYEARTPIELADDRKLYVGNQAYVVRPKSIPAILAQMKQEQVMDVDGIMLSSGKGVKTYVLAETMVYGGTGGQGLASERIGFPKSNTKYRQHLRGVLHGGADLKKEEQGGESHLA